jgi:hypothetical protein
MDRKTVGRILSQPRIVKLVARYQEQLLNLVPKAIDVYDDALISDDERVRVAVATKLVEGLQVMPRGNTQQIGELAARALARREKGDAQFRAIVNQMNEMILRKRLALNMPLPKEAAEIKAKIEAKTSAQGKPVVSETITEVLKNASK